MKKLDEILAGKKSVGLAGHVRPDGDCVGSTLGVYNYIRKYYPDVDVRLYLEPIPIIFKFLNFICQVTAQQFHNKMYFRNGPLPVFRRKSIGGDHLNAQIIRGADNGF